MRNKDLGHALLAVLLVTGLDAGAETQYPPDFEPVIVYQDAEYIASHSTAGAEPDTTPASPSAVDSKLADSKPKKFIANTAGGPFMQDYLIIGIAVLGLFGLYRFINKPEAKAETASPEPEDDIEPIEGETSVARYLRRLEAAAQKKASA